MAGATSTLDTRLAINGTEMSAVRVIPTSKYMFVDPNPELMQGDLDHNLERVSEGIQLHGLRVLMEPHPGELDVLIPLIGYSESPTDTFTPADSLTSFSTLVQLKASTKTVHTYGSCKINRAVFRGQKGLHPVSLELDIWALTLSEGSTYAPSTITQQAPYAFTKGSLSLRGTATALSSFVWVHDNDLQRRINNSTTADVLQNVNRVVHFGCNTPYTDDEDDILTTFISSGREAGIAGALTYTNGTKNLVFTMPKMLWEVTPPVIGPKPAEVRLDQFYKCYSTGGGAVCTITQDNT